MCFSIKIPKNIRQLPLFANIELLEKDAESIQKLFKAQSEMSRKHFDDLMGKQNSKKPLGLFKLPGNDQRILPGYFANVIIVENGKKILKPMRYQIRPSDSDAEIDGIYNARFDSLTTKKTWKPIFMRRHGLIPFTNFYEWVEVEEEVNTAFGLLNFLDEEQKSSLKKTEKRKKQLTFYPENKSIMWAPCLWDEWTSRNGEISFKSFAIITDEPPRDVEIMGHDRCPIFLNEKHIDTWLNPEEKNQDTICSILKDVESDKYKYEWLAS